MKPLVRVLLIGLLALGLVAAAAAVDRIARAPINEGRTVVFLVIGGDEGPPRSGTVLRSRADGLHLLVVAPDQSRATFVNIPRDSWVNIPGRGASRINTCLVYGPERCVQTVEALWGISVDHFVLTNMGAFRDAVSMLGGITVDVDRPVFDGGANVPETGVQRLSGSQALTFTRDRKNRPGGDFARTAAQGRLFRAAHKEMFESGPTLARVMEVVSILEQTTITDLRTDEMIRYGLVAMTIEPRRVDQVTLPARHGRAGAAAVVFLEGIASNIVRDVTADGVLSVVEGIVPGDD